MSRKGVFWLVGIVAAVAVIAWAVLWYLSIMRFEVQDASAEDVVGTWQSATPGESGTIVIQADGTAHVEDLTFRGRSAADLDSPLAVGVTASGTWSLVLDNLRVRVEHGAEGELEQLLVVRGTVFEGIQLQLIVGDSDGPAYRQILTRDSDDDDK